MEKRKLRKSKIKVNKPTSRPVVDKDFIVNDPDGYKCVRCLREPFVKQASNFPKAQSTLWKSNNGYIPICKHCIDDLFNHYKSDAGYSDEDQAMRRICMMFDVYWKPDTFHSQRVQGAGSKPNSYFAAINAVCNVGKTFDDTIVEEATHEFVGSTIEACKSTVENVDELIDFWGPGFEPGDYAQLSKRYKKLSEDYECKTSTDESLLRQIVMADWSITKGTQRGDNVAPLINSYNTLLDSANLKPKQNKPIPQESSKLTVGERIREWENDDPVPEASEEFKDVDGIIKYVSVWFLGHLCHMMKIKNFYSKLYEAEIAKYRVERPEYEDDDDEDLFDDVFSDGSGGDEDV